VAEPPDESGQSGFIAMQAAFEAASTAFPDLVRQRDFLFAGRPTRVRIVGPELQDYVTGAFEHLRSPASAGSKPLLEVGLWDEQLTGVACAARPTSLPGAPMIAEAGELWSWSRGRLLRYERPNAVTCLDRQEGKIVEWRSSAADYSLYERTKPLRLMLRVWYDDQHVQYVHSGLVARSGQGALLAGGGGAGKSTTSLACLRAGLDYLGDDFVGLEEQRDGTFVGHSLFSTVRLERHQMARFRDLSEEALVSRDPLDPKSLLFLPRIFPERLPRSAAIRVLLLPRVVDAEVSRLAPASRAQALLALAPSTVIAALGPGVQGFERLARLVRSVPTYWLELGRDLRSIPACVEEALARAQA
jgi:hypothetical protein